MDSTRFFIILIILFLLPISVLSAQQPAIAFSHLAPNDGLSQGTILSTLRDERGFLWVGTADGLNRYDGYGFRVFRHQPERPNSIIDNEVTALAEGPNGHIWVGTARGISRYMPDEGYFVNYSASDSSGRGLRNDYVTALFCDSKDRIWVGAKGGLERYDPQTNRFVHYPMPSGHTVPVDQRAVQAIAESSDGTIWIGFENGLFAAPEGSGQLVAYRTILGNQARLKGRNVRAVLEDHAGQLWVGTEAGLQCYEQESFKFRTPSVSFGRGIRALMEQKNGMLWVGAEDGLAVLDETRTEVGFYRHESLAGASLSDNTVHCLLEDKYGTVWVGTGSGLNYYNPYLAQFNTTRLTQVNPNDLANDEVWAITKGPGGALWLGAEGGLYALDDQMKLQGVYSGSGIKSIDSRNGLPISSIHIGKDGFFWLGTFGEGLLRFDPGTGAFQIYRAGADEKNGLSSNVIRSVAGGPGNTLWLATSRGLNRFDKATGRCKRYSFHSATGENLRANSVRTIFQDSRQMLWVGTEGGLVCFDYRVDTFQIFNHQPGDPTSLSHDFVRTVFESSDSTIWVGTSGGLNRLLEHGEGFAHYRVKDGLPNDVVYAIEEDARAHLWLSTNKGIARFDPAKAHFQNYDTNDGLQGNEFNTQASYQDEQGVLYFGGIQGFNYFHPARVRSNPNPPPVHITSLEYVNRQANTPQRRTLASDDTVRLSYLDYLFTFHFTALNFTNPQKNRYQYKLEGFDANWNEAGNRRMATYTNVPGGRYTFRVRAANNTGVWTEKPAAVPVIIRPPFWQTSLFWALAILLTGFLVFGFIHLRTRSVRHRNAELEAIVADRTQLLERQKEAIENSEALFRSFYEESPLGIAFYETVNGITRCNRRLCDMLGYEEAEILGTHLGEFTHPEDLTEDTDALIQAQSDRSKTIYYRDKRLLHREGYTVHVNTAASMLRRKTGEVDSMIIMLTDVTEEKLAQEELRQTQTRLLQADKMASLGQLTAGVAHEINNPVNFIYSGIGGLRKNLDGLMQIVNQYESVQTAEEFTTVKLRLDALKKELDWDEMLEDIEGLMTAIREGAERTAEIVQSLQTFSRIEQSEMQLADIHEGLNSTLTILNKQIKDNISIIKDYDPNIPRIACYPGQLNQVFLNILINAIQAIGDRQGDIRIVTRKESGCLSILLEDNGPGIPAEIQSRIFEPFFTTKTVGQGTGLGLSISYGIIEKHYGKIDLTSEEGKGTAFRIWLPLAEGGSLHSQG